MNGTERAVIGRGREGSGRRAALRVGLGTRIFLITSALIALAVGAAAIFTFLVAGRIAREAAERDLEAITRLQQGFREQLYEQRRLAAYLFVSDPYLTAYLAEAAGTGNRASVLDLLAERQGDLGYDFAMIVDPAGKAFVRTDRPAEAGSDLSERPLIAAAMERYEAVGIWREGDRLYRAVAVPIARGPELVGYLVTGFGLTDATADELKRLTGTDVVYLVTEPGSPARIVAGTLDPETEAQLVRAREAWGTEGDAELEIPLPGGIWIARSAPLLDAAGEPAGVTVALTPLAEQIRPFRRIGRVLLVSGALAVLAALVLTFAFARRTLGPVKRLVRAASAARAGDYDQRIATDRQDEIGELARAFDDLLSDLREKRDMKEYLAQIARSAPEPVPPSLTTAALDHQETLAFGTDATEEAAPTFSGIGPGSVVGDRFEILAILGRGGMGVVYKARDRELDEIVAVKMLRRDTAGDLDSAASRLRDELRLARRITHPNVLRTFDLGEVSGIPFISMEYVRGVTLAELLETTERLAYSAGLSVAKQLCQGLAAAHDQGVLHRDIKPANLILEPNGNLKVMDFGIARPSTRQAPGVTVEGWLVGTPKYLAPELLRGRDADVRSDLYACGVVLYEMFTGGGPYPAANAMEMMTAPLEKEPVPPSEHWAEIPPELEKILLTCLSRDPADRYASAEDLLADLSGLRA